MAGAVREIDESEWMASQQVVGTLAKMMANPKARALVLQARKEADPTAIIPEIDSAAPMKGEIDDIKKILAEDRAERAREREEAAAQAKVREFQDGWESKKRALREQGYTPDALTGIEKLAHERGLPDLEAAAALFDRMNPAPTIGQPGGGGASWDFFTAQDTAGDDKFIKDLWDTRGESDSVIMAEVGRTLNDMRAARR